MKEIVIGDPLAFDHTLQPESICIDWSYRALRYLKVLKMSFECPQIVKVTLFTRAVQAVQQSGCQYNSIYSK